MTTGCNLCAELERRLRAALEERDLALGEAGEARAKADAVAQSLAAAVPQPKPVRYAVVDALNSGLKRVLPWPHAGARAAARLVSRLRGK